MKTFAHQKYQSAEKFGDSKKFRAFLCVEWANVFINFCFKNLKFNNNIQRMFEER